LLLKLLDRMVVWGYGDLALGVILILLWILLRVLLWLLWGLLAEVLGCLLIGIRLGFVLSWVLEFRRWLLLTKKLRVMESEQTLR
jgi:hypothetical protein